MKGCLIREAPPSFARCGFATLVVRQLTTLYRLGEQRRSGLCLSDGCVVRVLYCSPLSQIDRGNTGPYDQFSQAESYSRLVGLRRLSAGCGTLWLSAKPNKNRDACVSQASPHQAAGPPTLAASDKARMPANCPVSSILGAPPLGTANLLDQAPNDLENLSSLGRYRGESERRVRGAKGERSPAAPPAWPRKGPQLESIWLPNFCYRLSTDEQPLTKAGS